MPECEQYRDDLMAWLDDALDGEAADALSHHVAQCDACRAERQWLEQVRGDLEAIGGAMVVRVPQIDIVDAVMAAVDRSEEQPQPSAFPARPRVRRSWSWAWASVAAAAAMLAFTWWFSADWGPFTGVFRMAKHPGTAPIGRPVPRPPATGPKAPGSESGTTGLETTDSLLAEVKRFAPAKAPDKRFSLPDLAALTVADVLQARRAGDDAGAALDQLSQWAALSPERARALLAAAGASREALVAAGRALPPSEGQNALKKAAALSPDDLYAQLALAEALSAQADQYAVAARELGRLSELDPANALPDYLLARNALAAGDVEAALLALSAGAQKQAVQSYSTSAAQAQAQALIELGMGEDAALVLSALTAGTNEYDSIAALSDDLLRYAQDLEAEGDAGVAQQIYEAVLRMGEQVYQGALFGMERLAGLDVQRAAVDLLERVYTTLNAQPQLEWLSTQVNNLLTPLADLAEFFNSIGDFFETQVNEDNAADIAQDILQTGDISISVRYSTPQQP